MEKLVERLRRAHGSPNWTNLEAAVHYVIDAAWNDPISPVRPRFTLIRGGLYSDPLPEEEWCDESEL